MTIKLEIPSQLVYSTIRLLADVLPAYHEGGRKYHVSKMFKLLVDAYTEHMKAIAEGKQED